MLPEVSRYDPTALQFPADGQERVESAATGSVAAPAGKIAVTGVHMPFASDRSNPTRLLPVAV